MPQSSAKIENTEAFIELLAQVSCGRSAHSSELTGDLSETISRICYSRDAIERSLNRYMSLYAKPIARQVKSGSLRVVSVGPQCATAGILRDLNLRDAAYPFDWLFSSLPMVEHCIRDRFSTFLDPNEIEPIPLELRTIPNVGYANHRTYKSMFGIDKIFNHHEMPEKTSHFQRASARFLEAMSLPTVFLAIIQKPKSDSIEAARSLAGVLHPNPLIVFEVARSKGYYGFLPVLEERNLSVTRFRCYGPLAALGFAEPGDRFAFCVSLIKTLINLQPRT